MPLKATARSRWSSLLEPADEPIAAAANGIPDDCIVALGGWENSDLTAGILRFEIDGGYSRPSAFDTAELEEALGITAEDPEIDGETAEIAFTTTEDGPPGSRVRDHAHALRLGLRLRLAGAPQLLGPL